MQILANLIVYFFIFIWIPYMIYCQLRFIKWLILPVKAPKPKKKKVIKEKAPPQAPPQAPPKGSYPIHASFREEHRITNPVEFDD